MDYEQSHTLKNLTQYDEPRRYRWGTEKEKKKKKKKKKLYPVDDMGSALGLPGPVLILLGETVRPTCISVIWLLQLSQQIKLVISWGYNILTPCRPVPASISVMRLV